MRRHESDRVDTTSNRWTTAGSRWVAATVLVAALTLMPSAASAQGLIVYAEDVPVERALRLGTRALDTSELQVMPLSQLTTPEDGRLQVYGDAEEQRCNGTLEGSQDFWLRLIRGIEAVDALREDEARVLLRSLRESMPCADEYLSEEALSELFFHQGILSVYAGEEMDSMIRFCESGVIHSDREFDPNYPPEAETLFRAGLKMGYDMPWATVRFHLAGMDVKDLRLDGKPLDRFTPELQVVPGYHLVQWTGMDGHTETVAFTVGSGKELLITSEEVIGRAILDGSSAHEWVQPVVRDRLFKVAKTAGGPEQIAIVGRDRTELFAPAYGSWGETTRGAALAAGRGR